MNPSDDCLPSSLPLRALLRDVFGAEPDHVARLAGGMSRAAVLDVRLGGRRYVVRHIDGSGPLDDAHRQLQCMTLAAERGVAPKLCFADPARGIVVMDFIEGPPIGPLLRADGAPLRDLAARFRALHDGPAFPSFLTPTDVTTAIFTSLGEAGAAPSVASELVTAAREAKAALAPHAVLAPCHNDPNTANLLFDGHRAWVIDWETAGQGDPFQDLASLGVFGLHRPPAHEAFVRAYLGREPSPLEAARLQVARVGSLAYFASTFFYGAHQRRLTLGDTDEPIPSIGDVLMQWSEHGPRVYRDPAWMGRVLAEEALRAYRGEAFRDACRHLVGG